MTMIKKVGSFILRLWNTAVIFFIASLYSLSKIYALPKWVVIFGLSFVVLNLCPSLENVNIKSKRIRACGNGCELLILFLMSTVCTGVYTVAGYCGWLGTGTVVANPKLWLLHTLVAVLVEAVIFWNGIIRIYLTSVQLGIRWRVIGIICGWIPIVHLIVLGKLIRLVKAEVDFEQQKLLLNESRKDQQICKTKYPILLVHGVFFRDSRYLNYWGRIPAELEKNGAEIYYGNHQSAASVEDSARELWERIQRLVKETGCEKVNIIAHSKGGLDVRTLLSMIPDANQYVASLTTINTPHRGCEFADYLLSKVPKQKQEAIAGTYNATLRKLGDTSPDFMAAVSDLTATACAQRNEMLREPENVYCQSVGSRLSTSYGGRFPLNFTYHLVHHFDGFNDGLVGEDSFPWGEHYQYLQVNGRRGISHGDVIDLNRENIPDFDVREFYVGLVSELREKGY